MHQASDIGIAILHAKTPPGVRRTQAEIAAYAGITPGGVFMLEQRALQKLRRKLHLHNDPVLKELCDSLLRK